MIYLIHPRRLEMLPPLISLLRILAALHEEVVYLGLTESAETHRILDDLRVSHSQYPFSPVTFKSAPCRNVWQKITRFLMPYLKRRWLLKRLRALDLDQDVLWTVEMEGAAILGDWGLKLGSRHIHSFYELGDEVGARYLGFDVKAFLRSATIVQCEYNRAHIFQAEHELPRLPFVLPNKPYAHPRYRNQVVTDCVAAQVVETWNGKRVFLYQGALQEDRGGLFSMIESLCRAFPDDVIAVMGRDTPIVRRLQREFPNLSYVPYVSPPHHLEVTSHADVGVAFYKGGRLFGLSPVNAVYCAPNKIYEYSGYGIPILCNDIPGLRYSVGINEAGVCLSCLDGYAVREAAKKILKEYANYSAHATQMYESVDLEKLVRSILGYARTSRR